jgi:hypothetical protein
MNTKFFTAPRDGKISLWVKSEGVDASNIWDLTEREFTPAVKNAITSAYEMGYNTAIDKIKRNEKYFYAFNTVWNETDKLPY